MRKNRNGEAAEVRKWFLKHVTCDGDPYVIDLEQAAAVADASRNTIVVARAGSGKTRTIVAKIVYLIARRGVRQDEIVAFVFNANAADEINARLCKMRVDGEPVVKMIGAKKMKVATTFHAFARKIVYSARGGKDKCGRILAGEKEGFVLEVLKRMMDEPKWRSKVLVFARGEVGDGVGLSGERGRVVDAPDVLSYEEVAGLAQRMVQFVNRAQQKFLAGENTLKEAMQARFSEDDVGLRERVFVELSVEAFRRYHWYLMGSRLAPEYAEYGTDFNLIMSWASKIIVGGRARSLLDGKKYILIDEYQDFSQLFLAVVLAIREMVPDVKLFVVGDDWQAINRFAGSDVEYFKEFERYFPEDSRRLEITTNYRCDKEIVNMARRFMTKAMGEKGDFRAFSRRVGKVILVEPSATAFGYGVVDYDARVSVEDKIYAVVADKMIGRKAKLSSVRYLKTLVEVLRAERGAGEILLLHRNNKMNLEDVELVKLFNALRRACVQLGAMSASEYDAKVKIMTIHKSKGLEAEVVIILEADEGVIPKLHPDTELYKVFGESHGVALDDQKRLFYVAMTRAKKRLYIIYDKSKGAGFVKYLGGGIRCFKE